MNNNISTCSMSQFQTLKPSQQETGVLLTSLKRISIVALVFAYVTLPIWGMWLASYYQLHTVSSRDLLLAICWMPASAAIIHLSFTKVRLHSAVSLGIFIVLNTLAGLVAWYFNLLLF